MAIVISEIFFCPNILELYFVMVNFLSDITTAINQAKENNKLILVSIQKENELDNFWSNPKIKPYLHDVTRNCYF